MKNKYILGEIKYRLILEDEDGKETGEMMVRVNQHEITDGAIHLSQKVEFSENILTQIKNYQNEHSPGSRIRSVEMLIEMNEDPENKDKKNEDES